MDNPLLKRKLSLKDIKPNVVGHWGTAPGQNFIYVHLNRVIKKYDLNMIYISGPGHGGQAMVANTYILCDYPQIGSTISGISRKCLTITMFFIGASLSQNVLKQVGVKPLVQGVLLWVLISVGSLLFIVLS